MYLVFIGDKITQIGSEPKQQPLLINAITLPFEVQMLASKFNGLPASSDEQPVNPLTWYDSLGLVGTRLSNINRTLLVLVSLAHNQGENCVRSVTESKAKLKFTQEDIHYNCLILFQQPITSNIILTCLSDRQSFTGGTSGYYSELEKYISGSLTYVFDNLNEHPKCMPGFVGTVKLQTDCYLTQ